MLFLTYLQLFPLFNLFYNYPRRNFRWKFVGAKLALARFYLVLFNLALASASQISIPNSFRTSRLLYLTNPPKAKRLGRIGGGKEVRTPDPLLAKQVLSQLSYTPSFTIFCTSLFALFSLCTLVHFVVVRSISAQNLLKS